jgi:hypothetical protein
MNPLNAASSPVFKVSPLEVFDRHMVLILMLKLGVI